MEAAKKQAYMLYKLLAITYLIGIVILAILFPKGLLSFTLGSLVSLANLYLAFQAFVQVFVNKDEPGILALFVGPFPKLLLIVLGSIACKLLPTILPALPYLIGVLLYAVVYLLSGVVDFFRSKVSSTSSEKSSN